MGLISMPDVHASVNLDGLTPVGATTNLVTTAADTNDVEWVGETVETNGFKTVTNRTEAATAAKFIKLEVSK